MRVLVLDGDVVSIANVYYLTHAGFEVVVVDRQDGPALETNFANASQVSPDYASPWVTSGIPLKAMRWLLRKHIPLVTKFTSDPSQYAWILQTLRNYTVRYYAIGKERMVRLSEYNRGCLDELRAETGITHEGHILGTTQLFHIRAQLDAAGRNIAVLERSDVPHEVLDRDGIAHVEPAPARVADELVDALRLPNDQIGGRQLFATRLTEMAKGLGVEFHFCQNVEHPGFAGDRTGSVLTDDELLTADHYVLALGNCSPQLLRSLGIRAPVYPLKSYSLTVLITNLEVAPTLIIFNETYKVVITHFDQHVHVGGMAEITDFGLSLDPCRRETLGMIITDLYPESDDISQATSRIGLRPATPDGTPIVDVTRYRNLFLSISYDTLGWTTTCRSGRYLADPMAEKRPQVSTGGLDISRYSSSPENVKNTRPAPAH